MAGGPSTPELVTAAVRAGTVGYLAGGYKTPEALRTEILTVREATDGAFGVNLFVPGQPAASPDALAAYVASIHEEASALGATPGEPTWDDDAFDAKVDVLVAHPPSIVTFTFGCPPPGVISALQSAGALVGITVTTPAEAALALRATPDCLCLQGAEAGAHRGSFTNDDGGVPDVALLDLLAAVRRETEVPLIAAGGISGPDDVAAALENGATQVQAGTAFLRCPESGAHPAYKDALADPANAARGTTITRAFSGRRARALVNRFTQAHGDAPPAYPEINNATRPLRAAASAQGDTDRMSLYAGVGFAGAEARSAGEVIERLVSGWRS
jgi:nitronate monooxygenase